MRIFYLDLFVQVYFVSFLCDIQCSARSTIQQNDRKQIEIRNCHKKLHYNQSKYIQIQQIKKSKKMNSAQFGEFCQISFEQFIAKSNQIQCHVIGTIDSISGHKKFVIEVVHDKKTVIRCYKRFTQFQSLYDVMKDKYPAYEIQEFPSRFQIFNKEETRKAYFQNLLNQIIKDYGKQNLPITKDLIRIVYNFLADHILQQKARRQLINKKKQEYTKNKQNVVLSMETDALSENGKKVIKKKIEESFQQQVSKIQRRVSIDCSSPTVRIARTRSNSAIQSSQPPQPDPQLQFQPTSTSTQNITSHTYDNEFEIKFSNQQNWKLGYIEIQNSSLYLFKNKVDNHFKTCIELYRINVQYLKRDPNLFDHLCQRAQLDLTRTFNPNSGILSLYHQYDHNKILIRKPICQNPDNDHIKFNLQTLKSKIIEASHIEPKSLQLQGVFNPIGKLFIFIHNIKCNWKKASQKQRIFLRIKTGALIHHTMPVSYHEQNEINQGFMLPISNTFERIRIQCYTAKDFKDKGNVIGIFKFSMVQFFIKPQRSLIDKLDVELFNQDGKSDDYHTRIQISLENLSDVSSLYSNSFANQTDGFPLKPVSGIDDIDNFSISIDRILTIIGTIKLTIKAFQRNVLKFKYPILGYAFFSFILMNVAFVDITFILRELIALILICIIYQQEHAHIIMKYLMDTYIFSYIHPNFRTPEVLSMGQITNLKWANQIKYIAEDYHYKNGSLEKKKNVKREAFQFNVHGRVFKIVEQEQSFFEKLREVRNILDLVNTILNSLAFTLEKVANLLSWVDTRRTLLVALILLILTGIASGTTLQLIICSICAAKLIKGTSYYQHKLYQKNRHLAIYCLRYILHKKFPEIVGKRSIHKDMSYFELSQYISDLMFPIHNESAAKTLKHEINRIMGVYLQIQALYPKATKQNNLRLVYLIDMIQTCDEKLKLKLVAGEEGVSDQFQQLIEETKDVQDIDDWFLEAAKNFVLNIPSRMFLIFHRKQLHKIQKAEIKQNQGIEVIVGQKQEVSFINKQENNLKTVEKSGQNKAMGEIDENILNAEIAKQKMMILKQVSLQ